MTHLTEDRLNRLAGRHPDGAIHETITELKSLVQKHDAETDPARKEALLSEVQTMSALLEHELRENSRGGEDFINDGEFFSS